MRRIRWAVLLACVLGAAPGLYADEPEFMAVFLDDVKVGYVRSQRTTAGEEVTHREDWSLVLQRGASSIAIGVRTECVETADGRPLRFSRRTQLGPMGAIVKRGRIRDGRIELTTDQMGARDTRDVAYPAGALMPEAAAKLHAERGLRPGTKFSYLAFDPDNLAGVLTEVSVGQRASVALIGQVVRLSRVEVTEVAGGRAVKALTCVDADGNVRKIEMDMLGMKLKLVGCDEAFAHSPNGRVDLVDAGSVASPVALVHARKLQRAVFTLTPVGEKVRLELPETGCQRVRTAADGTVTVSVALPSSGKGARPYMGKDPAAQEALASNDYIQASAPAVRKQARQIVGDQREAGASARLIEKWVRNYITKKDLTVGYASATAVLASRAGDCTEHAVLTAALCRAAGIPCRVVVGVVYTDEFAGLSRRFIGHAWNEAYIGGTWTPLDAALGADAARVALAVGGGDPTGFIAMVHSLGNFKITRIQTP